MSFYKELITTRDALAQRVKMISKTDKQYDSYKSESFNTVQQKFSQDLKAFQNATKTMWGKIKLWFPFTENYRIANTLKSSMTAFEHALTVIETKSRENKRLSPLKIRQTIPKKPIKSIHQRSKSLDYDLPKNKNKNNRNQGLKASFLPRGFFTPPASQRNSVSQTQISSPRSSVAFESVKVGYSR